MNRSRLGSPLVATASPTCASLKYHCAVSMWRYPALKAARHDFTAMEAGDWYTPKPRRGIVRVELGRGRVEASVSAGAVIVLL